MSIACFHSHLCYTSYVSLQGQIQDKPNRVFFHCRCLTGTAFHAGGLHRDLTYFFLQTSYLKFCHGNQTKQSLVITHKYWVDNHQMIITAKYDSHHFTGYGQNAILPFSHISMRAFCCHSNQTKRQITINLAILNCPYPSNICTKLES